MGPRSHHGVVGGLLTHSNYPWGSRSYQPLWTSILKEEWIFMIHSKSHIARLRLGLVGL